MTILGEKTREALLTVGTSPLTGLLFQKGLRNMFLQEVSPLRADLPRMVYHGSGGGSQAGCETAAGRSHLAPP